MEQEIFISGYCRVQDQSRMVTAVLADGRLEEADCCFPDCAYAPNCQIAKGISEKLKPEQ